MSPGDFNNTYTFYDRDPADGLDRLAGTRVVSGSTTLRQTTYRYPDARTVVQKSDVATAGDLAAQSVALYDGLGRPTTQRTYESASAYIETTTAYDALGRVASQTNPSRPGDGLGFATQYAYDALGRPVSATHQDGTMATNSYSGTLLTSLDEVGATKQIRYDWAGRIFSVVEDPAGLNYATNYRYDALDNLTLVSQGYCPDCQGRSFVYDGLSRLRSATNPESGTATYTYDPAGNPASRTDARQITTSYSYDAVNRVKTKVSDDGTVNVSWTYDSGTYAAGHLSAVSAPVSATSYGYDPFGRVVGSTQTTAGQAYAFGYAYNAAGALTGETYPSGRVVTQSYDALDRATSVSGSRNGSTTNYAVVSSYQPHGGLGDLTYGNSLNLTFNYDQQLRTNGFWTIFNNSSYAFEIRNWAGNGNLAGSSFRFFKPGSLSEFTQFYRYDAVNRLSSAGDSGGYYRTFGYDAYGNRSVRSSTGVPWSGLTPSSSGGVNPFNPGSNQINAGGYDAAGNQTSLGSLQISYDADSRQTATQDGVYPANSYVYDGNGKRVVKTVPGVGTTVYVYDGLGGLAAQYSDSAASSSPCSTCYLTMDHLGSIRSVTSESLALVAWHDYLPFGEEIPGNTAGRDSSFGAFDGIQQRFTGKERDGETVAQLDFSEARYYGAVLGRFTSPDPLNAGADLLNPQSWNAYSYVVNRPLSLIDPTGLGTCPAGSENTCIDVNSGPPEPLDTYSFCFVFSCGSGGFDFGLNRGGESGQQNQPPPSTPPVVRTQPANNRFTKAFLPPNANICFDNQNSFYAPPTFDIHKIEAAGKAGGWNPQAMNANVGHYGTFDFQRTRDTAGNTTFYSGYTPVSNLSVGAYLYSAGFSKSVASLISNTFALFKSSNAGDPAQATYRNLGFDTAARGQVPVCQSR